MFSSSGIFSNFVHKFSNGKEIALQVGYTTYGILHKEKDNVILLSHYFSASRHAVGTAEMSGWWDGLIGPGKAIDTDRYFVICMDNICNVQAKHPQVVTTGPATRCPESGKPYGMEFPPFSVQDMVEIQKAFLESRGISKLYAVIGPSFGGMISLQWAVSYPDWVERCIGVITNARNPRITALQVLQPAVQAIQLDPNWRGGMYYGRREPADGLRLAAQLMYAGAYQADFLEEQLPHSSGYAEIYYSSFAQALFEKQLEQRIKENVKYVDANHWLYTCRATMHYDIAHGYASLEAALARIQARVLLISCEQDLLQPAHYSRHTIEQLQALGKTARYSSFTSPNGHMAGILDVHLFQEEIRRWL